MAAWNWLQHRQLLEDEAHGSGNEPRTLGAAIRAALERLDKAEAVVEDYRADCKLEGCYAETIEDYDALCRAQDGERP